MRQHKIAAGVTAAGLALAVAAAVIGAPGHPHRALPRVPGFTLPALGHPGEHVSLAAYAGRPVVVNFFASWCLPCKKETPLLARFFRTPHGRVAMIGVDVNDATAAALRFVRNAGVTYPVGVDRAAGTATAWGVVAIPQTFFLDAGRHVIRRVLGAVTRAELTRDTAQLAAASGAGLADRASGGYLLDSAPGIAEAKRSPGLRDVLARLRPLAAPAGPAILARTGPAADVPPVRLRSQPSKAWKGRHPGR